MTGNMIEKLLGRVSADGRIEEISVFRHWIMALSSRYGLCCFIPDSPGIEMPAYPENSGIADKEMKNLKGTSALEAAGVLLNRKDIFSRSAGLAILNSILSDPDGIFEGESQLHYSEKARNMKTCFIGHFAQAEKWREEGYPVSIVELDPKPGDIHWKDASCVLGECEMVFITGLTLINDTFEKVLDLTPKANERILFGPTVPFCNFWFDYGITTVGSTRVVVPDLAKDFFAGDGSSVSRAPEGALKKVNISRDDFMGDQPCG